jgi:site-specific DNA recombinase
MGVKSIAAHPNACGARDVKRWGFGAIHKLLTRTSYVGRHRFGKPEAEVVEIAVPPIVDAAEFEAVQALLKIRDPALSAPRVVSGPTIPSGICFCASRGMAKLRCAPGRVGDTATTHARPRPGSAKLAARGARSGRKSSKASSPTTSKSD